MNPEAKGLFWVAALVESRSCPCCQYGIFLFGDQLAAVLLIQSFPRISSATLIFTSVLLGSFAQSAPVETKVCFFLTSSFCLFTVLVSSAMLWGSNLQSPLHRNCCTEYVLTC